ncbi:MAG: flagellar basal body rod protein FlgB [Desulfobacterales bacterium]|nr:flagellar basal body rod protein FlgB [Desulfobacterales bacterium]MBF0397503.1 flagellar basal body rod protein FlgB [Desulfobacterales bacterium]
MPKTFIFDKTYNVLQKSLDVSERKHSLISSNISNADTVGYKPKELDFQKTLERAIKVPVPPKEVLKATNPKHFKFGVGEGKEDPKDIFVEPDENEIYRNPDIVDIDKEMTNITNNNIKYRTTAEMLLRKMGMLRSAINEGAR